MSEVSSKEDADKTAVTQNIVNGTSSLMNVQEVDNKFDSN